MKVRSQDSQRNNSAELATSAEDAPRKLSYRAKLTVTLIEILVLGGVAVIVTRLLGASWQKILTIGSLITVIFVVGTLAAFYKKIGDLLDRGITLGFRTYFTFYLWLLVAFGPAYALLKLSRLVVQWPRPIQVAIFIVWGAMLAYLLSRVVTEKKRRSLFQVLESKIGRFAPLAYSFNLLLIAMVFFSSITYLSAHDRIRSVRPEQTVVTVDSLQDFYLWHFLEAVPLLKVNDTIDWKKPLAYDGKLIGWVVLFFKLTVIIPVIACFTSYWRNFGSARDWPVTAHRSARRVHSARRYTRRGGGLTYSRRTAR